MSRIVGRTFSFSLFLPLTSAILRYFLCKFTGGNFCKKQARQRRACCAYFALLWGHPAQPPEHPLHPLQPPEARVLRRERTARSTIPDSTVSTMMSPMTVTSCNVLAMICVGYGLQKCVFIAHPVSVYSPCAAEDTAARPAPQRPPR